jgi:hypothetical protein
VIDVARGGKLIINALENAGEYVTYAFEPNTSRNAEEVVCIPLYRKPDDALTVPVVATTSRFDVPTGIGSATNGIIRAPTPEEPVASGKLSVGVPVSDPLANVCGTTKFATNEPVVVVALFDVVGARVAYARSHKSPGVVVGFVLNAIVADPDASVCGCENMTVAAPDEIPVA